MRYRRLGRTGLMVSEVGFGALAIGGLDWGQVDDADSLAALRRAFELGVNFFDTADLYGRGHSEELIGRAFAGERPHVLIATKAGYDFEASDPPLQRFEPGYLRASLENSLRRLNTDYVDLFQLHNPPQKLARDDIVWDALAALKAEGKTRFFGMSVRTVNDGLAYLRAARSGDYEAERFGDTLQAPYNLLDQEAAAKGLLVEAHRADVGIISRVPLASGMLSGRYGPGHRFPPGDFRSRWSRERIAEAAGKVEALRFLVKPPLETMAQAALAFVLSQPAVSTVIPGAKTAAQVEENVAASDLAPLPDEDLRRAEELLASGFS